MNIQLIQGEFNSKDALELITQMIHIKIKYHEGKIIASGSEEDMKHREAKIKYLQKELYEVRDQIRIRSESVKMDAIIKID